MPYGVAHVVGTILFITDPFRRLLRSYVRNARNLFVFQFLPASTSHSNGHNDVARLDGTAFERATPLSNRQQRPPVFALASRCAKEPLAARFDRAVRATPRLIREVGRSRATGGVSGFNWAIASRFDRPGASSDGSGTDDCAAERSMTTGGVMVGLLVSRTTFSGHLRSDLIRIAALSI